MRTFLTAIVLLATSASAHQQPTQQQQPPPLPKLTVPGAPNAAPASTTPAGPYEFTTDIGAFVIVVKADKAAQFDAAMAKLKQALNASGASADRKRQAAGWRVLKSSELNPPVAPAGAVAAAATPPATPPAPPATTLTYLFLIEPVQKKASYNWMEIVQELAPGEVQGFYDQLKEAIVSATRVGLTELMKMGSGS